MLLLLLLLVSTQPSIKGERERKKAKESVEQNTEDTKKQKQNIKQQQMVGPKNPPH